MQIITASGGLSCDLTATIGFFDGVHRGHRALIADVRQIAEQKGTRAGIVTFRNHPKTVLSTHPMPLITATEERLERLASTGVDYCILLDFTPEMAKMSAYDFMIFLRDSYRVRYLVAGYDHRFGSNKQETYEDYRRYGEALGMPLYRGEACMVEGQKISSSLIRCLLGEGKVHEASLLLSYNYRLEGRVVPGSQIGHRIGFPTANIECSHLDKIVPARGVYAVKVYLEDGVERGGMLNIGIRPTVQATGQERTIEVHIFDFDRPLYGQSIRVEFVSYLRPERLMENLEALRSQLVLDKKIAQKILI